MNYLYSKPFVVKIKLFKKNGLPDPFIFKPRSDQATLYQYSKFIVPSAARWRWGAAGAVRAGVEDPILLS